MGAILCNTMLICWAPMVSRFFKVYWSLKELFASKERTCRKNGQGKAARGAPSWAVDIRLASTLFDSWNEQAWISLWDFLLNMLRLLRAWAFNTRKRKGCGEESKFFDGLCHEADRTDPSSITGVFHQVSLGRFLDDHEVPVESLLKGGPRKWQSKGMESEETRSVSTTHWPYFNLLYHFLRFHPFIFVSAT